MYRSSVLEPKHWCQPVIVFPKDKMKKLRLYRYVCPSVCAYVRLFSKLSTYYESGIGFGPRGVMLSSKKAQ